MATLHPVLSFAASLTYVAEQAQTGWSWLHRWAEERQIQSSIKPASFGSMRGAAAKEHLEAGATAVSMSEQCLIHEGTAAASDIVRCKPCHFHKRR